MHKRYGLALGVVLGAIIVMAGLTAPAQSQRPPAEETLSQQLARSTKLKEEDVIRLLSALGPAIQEELKRGKEVSLAGLGMFRIVRIAEHRDLRDGRPVIVPATNTIEFLPDNGVVESANSAAAQPQETVPAFQYNPLPGQTPGQKMGRTRVPPFRSK
jgi:nucleoid DNA-binding protein